MKIPYNCHTFIIKGTNLFGQIVSSFEPSTIRINNFMQSYVILTKLIYTTEVTWATLLFQLTQLILLDNFNIY